MADIVKTFSGDPVTISKKWRDGNFQTVIETSGKTKGQKAIEVFNSLYINSLLSGAMPTHQTLNLDCMKQSLDH